MFDTLIVFMKEFFEKVNFEKNRQQQKYEISQHARIELRVR